MSRLKLAPLHVKALAAERSPTCWIGGGDQGLQPSSSRLWSGSLGKHLPPTGWPPNGLRPGHDRWREWLERGLSSPKLVCPPRRTPFPGPARRIWALRPAHRHTPVVIAIDPHKASWDRCRGRQPCSASRRDPCRGQPRLSRLESAMSLLPARVSRSKFCLTVSVNGVARICRSLERRSNHWLPGCRGGSGWGPRSLAGWGGV